MIYTEITPNPASLKFVLGQRILQTGSADFPTVADTNESPVAKKLFDFRFVDRVFIGANYITITKGEGFQWEEIIPIVKDFLKSYIASEQPMVTGSLAEVPDPSTQANDDELTTRIKDILEDFVRPAVGGHGGDIIYENFSEGTLYLRLQGSCSGCPSSTFTLKQGIENLMVHKVPEVKRVEAV